MKVLDQLACPSCHSNFEISIYRKRRERVWEGELKCQKCGKKFLIKNEIAYFIPYPGKQGLDDKTARKDILNHEIPKKWMNLFSKQELKALKKEWQWMLSSIKKSKSAIHLDFATGTGRFLRNIVPIAKGEIAVLDFGYSTCKELAFLLRRIKKYQMVSVICADARKMPFRDNTFDSVSTWHGLDEMKMGRAIKEAYRVLKSKGYFVASGVHYLKGSKSFRRAKKHNINFLTKEMIVKALQNAGFHNIEHKIFFEGRWNEKGDYLPMFNDWYISYAIRAQK